MNYLPARSNPAGKVEKSKNERRWIIMIKLNTTSRDVPACGCLIGSCGNQPAPK
ncbi:hypothetical protein [Petrotoga mobilis]|uniref:hypothetical protein n=1 Tax=Petrotoga mobilis TaxID=69499 RepID=UPI00031E8782|nr:hypothetical protein [Petrotoga mobilis]